MRERIFSLLSKRCTASEGERKSDFQVSLRVTWLGVRFLTRRAQPHNIKKKSIGFCHEINSINPTKDQSELNPHNYMFYALMYLDAY